MLIKSIAHQFVASFSAIGAGGLATGYQVVKGDGTVAAGGGTVSNILDVATVKIDLAAGDIDTVGPVSIFGTDGGGNVRFVINEFVVEFTPAVAGDEMALINGALTAAKIGAAAFTDAAFPAPTNPSAPATGLLSRLDQLWRRFFKRTVRTSSQIRTYKDDASTIATTQNYSSSPPNEDLGAAT